MRRLCLAIPALFLLASCGSGPPEAAPSVSEAAAKTLAEGTAKTYTKQVMAFDDASQGTLIMESEGVVDFENMVQKGTMTSSGEGGQAAMTAAQIGDMELISKGFVAYFKADIFEMLMEPGTEWLKLDLQAAGEEMGMDLGSLTQLGSSDPSQQLNYLKGVENVQEIGIEDVRGVETTHYRGTASFDALKEELPDDGDETIDRLQEIMGIDEFDVEVWLDSDGLARRMRFEYDALPMGGTSGTAKGTWTFVLEYYDFGTEVDVEIPDDDEVTDMLEAIKEMQAGDL